MGATLALLLPLLVQCDGRRGPYLYTRPGDPHVLELLLSSSILSEYIPRTQHQSILNDAAAHCHSPQVLAIAIAQGAQLPPQVITAIVRHAKTDLAATLARLPEPTTEDVAATHVAIHTAWRHQVISTLQAIWRWRTAPDDPTELWTTAAATAYHDASLHAVLHDLRWPQSPVATPHPAAAIGVLQSGSTPATQPLSTSDIGNGRHRYLLFFDGGSRGNPGAGGSGAVVVQVAEDGLRANVIWTAAMSYAAATTTNNQAEYNGLQVGLAAARAHNWTPLEVIGDSLLIIQQMRRYRPPSNPTLREKYATARRLADMLGVQRWHHHLRATNKMADAAANLAMDSRSSSQVHHSTDRADHNDIAGLLDGDLAQWRLA